MTMVSDSLAHWGLCAPDHCTGLTGSTVTLAPQSHWLHGHTHTHTHRRPRHTHTHTHTGSTVTHTHTHTYTCTPEPSELIGVKPVKLIETIKIYVLQVE